MLRYELTPAFLRTHTEEDYALWRSIYTLPPDFHCGICFLEPLQNGDQIELLPGLFGYVDNYACFPGQSEVWYRYDDAMAITETLFKKEQK